MLLGVVFIAVNSGIILAERIPLISSTEDYAFLVIDILFIVTALCYFGWGLYTLANRTSAPTNQYDKMPLRPRYDSVDATLEAKRTRARWFAPPL